MPPRLLRKRRQHGSCGWTLIALVVLVGLGLTASTAVALHNAERAAAGEVMDRRTATMRDQVAAESQRYVDAIRLAAAALSSQPEISRDTFDVATAALPMLKLSGATSVAFLAPATDEQVPAVQQRWRDLGVADLELHPVGTGNEHIFSIMQRSLDDRPTAASGLDVTQASTPTEAMAEARRSSRVTVSNTYLLLRDRDLPKDEQQLSFILAAPVYSPAPEGTRGAFRGWLSMGMRGGDFINGTLLRGAQGNTESARGTFDVRLFATISDGSQVQVAALRRGTGELDLHRESNLYVAQRRWALTYAASAGEMANSKSHLASAAMFSGGALTLLFAVLVYVLSSARRLAELQVRTATEQLRVAEQEAREQADLMTAIMESIGDGVTMVDEHGAFLVQNPAARKLLGVDTEVDGAENWQSHYGVYRSEDGQTPFPVEEMPLVRALAGESTDGVEMFVRNAGHPEGVIICVSGRPLAHCAGRPGAVAVFHDITARKYAEDRMTAANIVLEQSLALRAGAQAEVQAARDELADQKSYLTQVLDSLDVAITTWDAHGRIVHRNRTARKWNTAGDEATRLGELLPNLQIAHPDGRPVRADDLPAVHALAGAVVDGQELVLTPEGGARRHVLMHARPLRDSAGTIVGVMNCTVDVTTLREREAELRAFAAIVAHDLKSPLTSIAGFSDLAAESLRAGEESVLADSPEAGLPRSVRDALASVERVSAGAGRMRRLIDDLLTYTTSRDVTLRPTGTELRAVVDDVVNALADRPEQLDTAPPQIYVGPLPAVYADPVLLRHLMDNLIGNAVKYSPPGQPAHIDVTAQTGADRSVRVEITDRGIGIPAGQHAAIFASFHRAHHGAGYTGTGLGLAICQRIVERHGGTIGALDNPGGGARFFFTLPAAPPTAQERPGPARRRTDQPTTPQPR